MQPLPPGEANVSNIYITPSQMSPHFLNSAHSPESPDSLERPKVERTDTRGRRGDRWSCSADWDSKPRGGSRMCWNYQPGASALS